MERKPAPVKPKREYDSTRRRAQARQTREAILDVARRRFLADGFAPTTIAAIAAEAGVSVDSIYKTFGRKAGPGEAFLRAATAGRGPRPGRESLRRAGGEPARSPRHHPGLGHPHH